MLYDVDIEASACVLSSRYAMLCYAIGEVCGGAKPPKRCVTEVIKTAKSRLLHVPKHPYGSIMS